MRGHYEGVATMCCYEGSLQRVATRGLSEGVKIQMRYSMIAMSQK